MPLSLADCANCCECVLKACVLNITHLGWPKYDLPPIKVLLHDLLISVGVVEISAKLLITLPEMRKYPMRSIKISLTFHIKLS